MRMLNSYNFTKFSKKKMAAVMSGSQVHSRLKLTKAERRTRKKQNKALQKLKNRCKEVGAISDVPTPYLLVKNGGLMCGIKRQDLLKIFHKYGQVAELLMVPGKSFSYVIYNNAESARQAMGEISGQKIALSEACERILYLAYLLKRPCPRLSLSDRSHPPGMILLKEFIDSELECELMRYFSSCDTPAPGMDDVEQHLKHRYVKHYGYEFMYGSNNVQKDSPLPQGIPDVCMPIIEKLSCLDCVVAHPDQMTVNEYLPGQGIPPHVDTHSAFEDGIISVSLGAEVVMDFRHKDGHHVSIMLPQRSALIMTEECRYAWSHGITPRKYDVINEDNVIVTERCDEDFAGEINEDGRKSQVSTKALTLLPRKKRLSLTFRKIRRTPCDCKYPANCDSRNYGRATEEETGQSLGNARGRAGVKALPKSEEDAVELEREHVHDVYECIAEHFSGTRHTPWPKIAEFLRKQRPGSLVADVGCGNGKYLGINRNLYMFGSDRSRNLAGICRQRGFHVVVCDIMSLPYRSDSFDVCVCIAVIHHMSTSVRREAAIRELTRIVRPGGRILISVWALEQNLDGSAREARKDTRDLGLKCPRLDDDNSVAEEKRDKNVECSIVDSMLEERRKGGNDTISCTAQNTPDLNETLPDSSPPSTKHPLSLKINESRGKFEQQDLLIPWHYRGQTGLATSSEKTSSVSSGNTVSSTTQEEAQANVYQRYYHVFKEGELVEVCKTLNNITVVSCYYDKGNWCVELEKTGDRCG